VHSLSPGAVDNFTSSDPKEGSGVVGFHNHAAVQEMNGSPPADPRTGVVAWGTYWDKERDFLNQYASDAAHNYLSDPCDTNGGACSGSSQHPSGSPFGAPAWPAAGSLSPANFEADMYADLVLAQRPLEASVTTAGLGEWQGIGQADHFITIDGYNPTGFLEYVDTASPADGTRPNGAPIAGVYGTHNDITVGNFYNFALQGSQVNGLNLSEKMVLW